VHALKGRQVSAIVVQIENGGGNTSVREGSCFFWGTHCGHNLYFSFIQKPVDRSAADLPSGSSNQNLLHVQAPS
jgi:hypothetical protein